MANRKPLIEEDNPLMEKSETKQTIPSATITRNEELKKTFSYRIPVRLGMKFKFYCHQNGTTAEAELENLLEEWLADKQVIL